jgi:hypothetical protein
MLLLHADHGLDVLHALVERVHLLQEFLLLMAHLLAESLEVVRELPASTRAVSSEGEDLRGSDSRESSRSRSQERNLVRRPTGSLG